MIPGPRSLETNTKTGAGRSIRGRYHGQQPLATTSTIEQPEKLTIAWFHVSVHNTAIECSVALLATTTLKGAFTNPASTINVPF